MSKACIESIRGLDNYYNICSQLHQHLDAFSTQAHSGCSQEVGSSQGHNESDLDYDVRLTRSARAAVLAEVRAGMTTAELYRALALHNGPMRVAESHMTRSYLSSSNTIPLLTRQRSGDR